MHRLAAAAAQYSEEWSIALFWSLAGLDLSLWLLGRGVLLGSAELVNALMM